MCCEVTFLGHICTSFLGCLFNNNTKIIISKGRMASASDDKTVRVSDLLPNKDGENV